MRMSASRIDDYLEHTEALERLALVLVRDATEAQELVQETWLVALMHPNGPQGSSRRWLGGVLRNLVLRSRRTRTRRLRRERRAARAESVPPGQRYVDEADLHRYLATCIRKLPADYRHFLELRYFKGLAPKEIGMRLGVPASTVRTRVQRGLERLRVALGERPRTNLISLMPLLLAMKPKRASTASANHGYGLGAAAAVLLGVVLVCGNAVRNALEDTTDSVSVGSVDAVDRLHGAAPLADAAAAAAEATTSSARTVSTADWFEDAPDGATSRQRPGAPAVRETAPRRVAGLVVNEDGVAIRGATVALFGCGDDGPAKRPLAITRSGPDGRYELTFKAGSTILVVAIPGYVPTARPLTAGSTVERQMLVRGRRLELSRAYRRAAVRLEAKGLVLELDREEAQLAWIDGRPAWTTSTLERDASGALYVSGLEARRYAVAAEHEHAPAVFWTVDLGVETVPAVAQEPVATPDRGEVVAERSEVKRGDDRARDDWRRPATRRSEPTAREERTRRDKTPRRRGRKRAPTASGARRDDSARGTRGGKAGAPDRRGPSFVVSKPTHGGTASLAPSPQQHEPNLSTPAPVHDVDDSFGTVITKGPAAVVPVATPSPAAFETPGPAEGWPADPGVLEPTEMSVAPMVMEVQPLSADAYIHKPIGLALTESALLSLPPGTYLVRVFTAELPPQEYIVDVGVEHGLLIHTR